MTREPSLRVEPSSETPSPKDAQVVGGTWAIGYSDGSGAGEDGYSITVNNYAIVLSGVSFGLPYGIQSREIAERIVKAVNSHDEAKIAAAVKALETIDNQIDDAEFEDINDDDDLVVITVTAEQARSIKATLSSLKEGK